MNKILSLSVICLALAGCLGNTVQDLESSLSVAEASALVYVNLEPCSPTSSAVCSKYSIVQTIDNSREAAEIAVKAAREAEDDSALLSVADTAAMAFKDIINSDVVQNALNGGN